MNQYQLGLKLSVTYEFKKELLDVKRGEQLALAVNYDLARWFAWDGLEWLHNLLR